MTLLAEDIARVGLLTAKQKEVLKCLAQGYTLMEINKELYQGKKTSNAIFSLTVSVYVSLRLMHVHPNGRRSKSIALYNAFHKNNTFGNVPAIVQVKDKHPRKQLSRVTHSPQEIYAKCMHHIDEVVDKLKSGPQRHKEFAACLAEGRDLGEVFELVSGSVRTYVSLMCIQLDLPNSMGTFLRILAIKQVYRRMQDSTYVPESAPDVLPERVIPRIFNKRPHR